MHPDLQALLALQVDDHTIRELETRRAGIDARIGELDRERDAAAGALRRKRTEVEEFEHRRRDLQDKNQQRRTHHERNLSHLDAARKTREATAAMAEVDITRKALLQEESEIHGISTRISEMRQAADFQELEITELETRQLEARGALDAERQSVDAELADARAQRDQAASTISRPILSKYERISARQHGDALFALRNSACGHCNTAIPLQRRNVIANGRAIEVCEGCGVLLYASV